jgi:hypothetical protein
VWRFFIGQFTIIITTRRPAPLDARLVPVLAESQTDGTNTGELELHTSGLSGLVAGRKFHLSMPPPKDHTGKRRHARATQVEAIVRPATGVAHRHTGAKE